MSDEKQRLVDDYIDQWLADVDGYREHINSPENPLHRFAVPLEFAINQARQARVQGDQQKLLFSVVFLARVISTVHEGFFDWAFEETDRLDAKKARALEKLIPAALSLAEDERARLLGLAAGRKTQQQKRRDRDEKLRAEFDRLRKSGMSRSRAAEILSKPFQLSADTIRKRFGK